MLFHRRRNVFQLFKYRLSIMREILPYTRGARLLFAFNMILSIVMLTTDFAIPLLYKTFIEETIISGRLETLLPIIIGYIGINLFVIGIQYLVNYNNNYVKNHVTFGVKNKIWQNLFKVDFQEYEHWSIGDVKMNMEDDISALSNFSRYYTIEYLIQCATVLISMCVLFIMEWRLALFAIICIPLTTKIDFILSKREMMLNDEQRNNDQEMNSWLYNSLQGWKEIKALNLERRQKMIFAGYIKKYAVYYAKWVNYWVFRVLIIPKIRNEFFMQFGLYFLGGLLVMKGEMTIGMLLVFVTYFELLTKGILNVSSIDADLQGKKPYLNRLFDVLNKEYPEEKEIVLEKINSIQLCDVHYSYPEQEEILNGVDLSIKQGERIAITGKSGCGKTTLLKIIAGMLEPGKGSVKYSGVDLQDINLISVHKRIGFIMQNSFLYNISIRENLLLGNDKATESEMIDACKKACIYDYIMSLSEGFDTIIGEGGSKLSGGQKQRIILARTFLRDVDVFIFDEATSALDQYSEKVINDAITNISRNKIVIVVAHRTSSINLCDRVIQME